MQYDLNQIGDPVKFQQLVNAILVARFGEDARLTPLRGPDGGSDGETAAGNPHMEFHCTTPPSSSRHPLLSPPRPGRYIFQAKYHPTGTQRLSDLRARVVQDFENELQNAVLRRSDRLDVTYFFVVTNVPASKSAFAQVDALRRHLVPSKRPLHADVWWHEMVTTFLDWSPELWPAFPDIFPGRTPPLLAQTITRHHGPLSTPIRTALVQQHTRDRTVKFRQIELDQQLYDLFVDLDVELRWDPDDLPTSPIASPIRSSPMFRTVMPRAFGNMPYFESPTPALELLLDDELALPRLLIEGGPGQGKSTITQMAAQLYRERLLDISDGASRNPTWRGISKPRLPIRLELRHFAEWLSDNPDASLEQFIAAEISHDSGGRTFTVDHLHEFAQGSSLILLLDGLDEIGSDRLRDAVLDIALTSIDRLERGLRADLRVVLTTRPPALTGRRDKLASFTRAILTPMAPGRVDEYLHRWLTVQIATADERDRIRDSFAARRHDQHVDALSRNPMQLSVLLNLIRLKGDAFPDQRADLYREYFRTVIDRDVEKSPELRQNRDMVEGLHSYLGFRLHGAAEVDRGRRTLSRNDIIKLAESWLREQDPSSTVASKAFALGEERFGLIVATSGEGDATRYGFEVQPIQEYFAASYISDRLSDGRAHEVFELLIHRSYWREVGLFLAGLRRPNEKADLVARARAADKDVLQEWQQNGRLVVLQLLREGVLGYPRHVLAEALDFVMELLDIEHLRMQRHPDTTIETLCQVGVLYPTDELRQRIVQTAAAYSESSDVYAVFLIHRLAARLLPADEYRKVVIGYRGPSPRIRSLVRMTCPYESSELLEALGRDRDYWTDVPPAVWARCFWRAARARRLVLDLEHTARLHSHLVVEFAVDHLVGRQGEGSPVEVRPSAPLAIWKLLQNLQVMGGLFADRSSGDRAADGGAHASAVLPNARGALEASGGAGLPDEIAVCLRDLIATSESVILAMVDGSQTVMASSLRDYMRAIEDHLKDPGITAWVASRCASQLFQRRISTAGLPLEQGLLDSLAKLLSPLYGL